MLIRLVLIVLPALWALAATPAQAQTRPRAASTNESARVALVIGNNDYQHVQKLNNAVPDAKAMAKEFRSLGFEVIEKTNVDQRAMKAAIREFVKRIGSGGVGAFFYAGHGVQEGGDNFLLPIDVGKLTDSGALSDEAVELNGDIMARIGQAGAKFSLLVIDACRDNPFPKRAGRSVGGTRGLTAAAETPEGMVVVYSAGVGQQALDRLNDTDRHPNGLFTREFIVELRKPGVEVADMVRNVRQRVKEAAATVQHEQTPAIYIQADRFYLVAPPPPSPPALPNAEDALWAQLDSTKPCEYQAYLEQYPQGKFSSLARIRARECAPSLRPPAKSEAVVAMAAAPQPKEKPVSLPLPGPVPADSGKAAPSLGAGQRPGAAPAAALPDPQAANKKDAPGAAVPAKTPARPVQEASAPVSDKPSTPPAAAVSGPATGPGKTAAIPARDAPAAPVPASSPFSAVKGAPPAKPAGAGAAAAATTSSVLELPLPVQAQSGTKSPEKPKAAPLSNGAKPGERATSKAEAKLDIQRPPPEAGTQLAMLAPTKDAMPATSRKLEPGDQPQVRTGDAWAMRRVDLFTRNVIASWTDRVQSREGDRLKLDSSGGGGIADVDLASWTIASPRVVEGKPLPLVFPLAVGKSWEYSYRRKRNDDQGVTIFHVKATVERWEKVETPAGSFDAFKVVHKKSYETSQAGSNWSSTSDETYWYAPEARRWVRYDFVDRGRTGRIVDQFREELVKLELRP